jgi:HEAT repeats
MRHAIVASCMLLDIAGTAWAQTGPIVGGRPMSEWLAQLDDALPGAVWQAARMLGSCGPRCTAALPPLQQRMGDPSASVNVRVAMAHAIIQIDTGDDLPDVIAFLAGVLQQGYAQHGPVTEEAIDALGDAGPRARPACPVLEELRHHWAGSTQMKARRAAQMVGCG